MICVTTKPYIMRRHVIIPVTVMLLLLFNCTSEKPEEQTNPLIGVWELVSSEHYRGDSVLYFPSPSFPDMKSIKIFTEGHFNTTGGGAAPISDFWSLTGTYEINGDEYTQSNILSSSGNTGNKLTMKFIVHGDTLRQESSRHKEVWKRIE